MVPNRSRHKKRKGRSMSAQQLEQNALKFEQLGHALLGHCFQGRLDSAKTCVQDSKTLTLRKGKSLVTFRNEFGQNPLMQACRSHHAAVVSWLLSYPEVASSAHTPDAEGVTALMWAARQNAARSEDFSPDADAPNMLLFELGSGTVLGMLLRTLGRQHADTTAQHMAQETDIDGNTALHWACREGNLPAVQQLCMAGFELTRQNNADETPLWLLVDRMNGRLQARRAAMVDAGQIPHSYPQDFARVSVEFAKAFWTALQGTKAACEHLRTHIGLPSELCNIVASYGQLPVWDQAAFEQDLVLGRYQLSASQMKQGGLPLFGSRVSCGRPSDYALADDSRRHDDACTVHVAAAGRASRVTSSPSPGRSAALSGLHQPYFVRF
eukprot:g57029.t1